MRVPDWPLLERPERLYLLIALPVVLALCVLTPPFQAADEPAHLFRAVQLSQGSLLGTRPSDGAGGTIPAQVVQLASRFSRLGAHPEQTVSAGEIVSAFGAAKGDRSEMATLPFPIAPYFPGAYLPQTVAVGVTRVLRLPPLAWLYAARLLNALFGVWLLAMALRSAAGWALPFLWLGLLPMLLFQFASASADGPILAGALFFASQCLRLPRLGADRRAITRWTIAAFAAVLIPIATKPVYAPLLAMPVLVLWRSVWTDRFRLLLLGAGPAAVLGTTFVWLKLNQQQLGVSFGEVDSHRQLAGVLAAPGHALWVFRRDWVVHARDYWTTFVGCRLGWLDAPLPGWVAWTAAAGGVSALVLDRAELRQWTLAQRLIAAGLALAGGVAIQLSLYLIYTPVGANTVDGVQGRYFIALAPLLLLALLIPAKAAAHRMARLAVIALAVLQLGAALVSVYQRYYVPADARAGHGNVACDGIRPVSERTRPS